LPGPASTAVAASTKAEFIKRGDALCVGMAKELAPLRRRADAAYALAESRRMAAAATIWGDHPDPGQFQPAAPRDRRATRRCGRSRSARAARPRRRACPPHPGRLRERRIASLSSALPAYIGFTLTLNRKVKAYGFRVCGQ
jgi:hypothetical protein